MANYSYQEWYESLSKECYPWSGTIFTVIFAQFGCLLYATPSITLYILILIGIHKDNKRLSKSFLHIFTVCSFCSIVSWSMDFLMNRTLNFRPLCPYILMMSGTYYLILPFFILNTIYISNLIACIGISLNQFTAIFLPIRHEQLWQKYSKLFTVSTFLIPCILVAHLLFSNIAFYPMPSGRIVARLARFLPWMDKIQPSLITFLCALLTSVLIILLTLLSVARLLIVRSKSSIRVDYRVFLLVLWMSILALIFAIYEILLYWATLDNNMSMADVMNFRGFVMDLCFLSPPWVALLVNSVVRSSVLKLVGLRSSATVVMSLASNC